MRTLHIALLRERGQRGMLAYRHPEAAVIGMTKCEREECAEQVAVIAIAGLKAIYGPEQCQVWADPN